MVSNNEYMRQYMKDRYYRRRAAAIVQLGGKCIDCGSVENLEFDHADASTKQHDIGKLFAGGSEEKLQAELVLCVLRCNEHHKKKSTQMKDIRVVGHGEGLSGKRNCSCEPCRSKKREYMRAYAARRKGLEA